jgi:hypothetical protein
LAFGAGFLLQLRDADARLVSSSDGSVIATVPLAGPRAVIGLPGGSVLVSASDASYRFDPGQQRAHRVARLSLLPSSLLEPSRESAEHVWVIEPSLGNATRYAFASKEFAVEATRVLPGYDGKALTTLRDGAFLYTSSTGLVRLFAGRALTYSPPPEAAQVWRLLPADRLDQAWYVTVTGEALLLELGVRARVRRRFLTEGGPFDVGVARGALALISVYERPQETRRFVLNLYSATGTQVKSYPLGSAIASDENDWAARVSSDHELAVSERPPRVAVGGSSSLRLFDIVASDEIVIH